MLQIYLVFNSESICGYFSNGSLAVLPSDILSPSSNDHTHAIITKHNNFTSSSFFRVDVKGCYMEWFLAAKEPPCAMNCPVSQTD